MIQDRVEKILGTVVPLTRDGKRAYRVVINHLNTQGKFTPKTSNDLLIAILEYLDEKESKPAK